MTYTANIPQATDDPSQSQGLILQNFMQLNSQYGTAGDHVAFTAVDNNGKHNKATFLDQSGAVSPSSPPVPPGASQVVEFGYTKTGVTMPYYLRDNVTIQFPISPIKAYAQSTISGNTITANDYFNFSSITVVSNGPGVGGKKFLFQMGAACRTSQYGIIAFMSKGGSLVAESIEQDPTFPTSTTQFQLQIVTTDAVYAGNITVIVLES